MSQKRISCSTWPTQLLSRGVWWRVFSEGEEKLCLSQLNHISYHLESAIREAVVKICVLATIFFWLERRFSGKLESTPCVDSCQSTIACGLKMMRVWCDLCVLSTKNWSCGWCIHSWCPDSCQSLYVSNGLRTNPDGHPKFDVQATMLSLLPISVHAHSTAFWGLSKFYVHASQGKKSSFISSTFVLNFFQ